jgi:hypothetical protein
VRGLAREWEDVKRNISLLNELLREIGTSVEQIVQGYPEGDLYLRLLGLKEEWMEQDSKFVEELVRGTRHHRNHRDVRIYIGDLLLGWVVQDAVTMLLRKAGYECLPAGADAARQLLTGRQVTEEPDLWLRTPTGEIWWLDVLTDYPMKRGALSYWLEKKRCDLRDNKFKRLMEKREEGAQVGLISVSIGTKKYFGLALTDDLMEELEKSAETKSQDSTHKNSLAIRRQTSDFAQPSPFGRSVPSVPRISKGVTFCHGANKRQGGMIDAG